MGNIVCDSLGERVRINLSETAKGCFQIDCTAESNTVERSKELIREAIKAAKDTMAEFNLQEAH